MNPIVSGLMGVLAMLVLIFLGLPTPVVFFSVGFFGLGFYVGWVPAFQAVADNPFTVLGSFQWTVMPMFVMMGIVLFETKIGEEIFFAMAKWLGHLPGGMAQSVCAACAFIGAMTGSGYAATALMAKIAYPEMRKYYYQPDLSLAVIAAAAPVAMIIPPSMMMCTYAILAEQSAGECLIAGFIPGFLSMGVFMFMIFLRAKMDPSMAPALPAAPWRDRLVSLRYLIPVFIMMVVIIGGLTFGVFTASEAAGIGTFISLIIAATMRRVTWAGLKATFAESGRLAILILISLMSVRFFSTFLNLAGITIAFSELALALPSKWITFIMVLFVYFILGMFIGGTLSYITVPMFAPVLKALGFDLVWFGVVTIMLGEVGAITPPVCMTTFIAQGIIQEVSMERAYNAVWLFVGAHVVVIALITAFPQIALWLPYLGKAR